MNAAGRLLCNIYARYLWLQCKVRICCFKFVSNIAGSVTFSFWSCFCAKNKPSLGAVEGANAAVIRRGYRAYQNLTSEA